VTELQHGIARRRRHDDDSVSIFERRGAVWVVVADGAGGRAGGAAASRAFVDAFTGEDVDAWDVRAWKRVFERLDRELFKAGRGETTAVVVAFGADGIVGMSVGDSEAWLVTPERVDRLTAGQTRARLGTGRAAPAHFHRAALDGVFVAATDGLFAHADASAVVTECRRGGSAKAIAERLADLTCRPDGTVNDDASIVCVRC
jgi:serine/threonine protein phosphatase PrpC